MVVHVGGPPVPEITNRKKGLELLCQTKKKTKKTKIEKLEYLVA
jgi:hypothetical protein